MKARILFPLIAAALASVPAYAQISNNVSVGNTAKTLIEGYTCCNFHYEDDWISDGNYASLPMLPLGAKIKVLSYGRHRAAVQIDGKPMRLGHDYGRAEESLEQWVAKQVVGEDPKSKMAKYPTVIQAAIRDGKVMKGMTREQVTMSVGHPLTSENKSPDATTLRYWISSFGEYHLRFDDQGKVSEIIGDAVTLDTIVYQPTK